MSQHAPQAPFAAGGSPPAPAPDDQRAALGNKNVALQVVRRAYGELTKEYPPPNLCLPLNIEISIAELMTFFPNSAQIPGISSRLMRNGFQVQTVAKMQLNPVNESNKKNEDTVEGRLKWQYVHADQCEWADKVEGGRNSWKNIAKEMGPQHDLTANHLKLRHEYEGREFSHPWGHWKLQHIYEAIDDAKWPQGNDRLTITQCLEFAKSNPQLDLDTSHWD